MELMEVLKKAETGYNTLSPEIEKTLVAKYEKEATSNIGGFVVHDDTYVENMLKRHSNISASNFRHFEKDRDDLASRLINNNIAHLAIIPTIAWNNIVKKHNLVTINPDFNGKVPITTLVPFEISSKFFRPYWYSAAVLLPVLSAVTGYLSYFHGFEAGFAGVVGTLGAAGTMWGAAHYLNKKNLEGVLKGMSKVDLIKSMLDRSRWYSFQQTAEVILPAPPKDVVANIVKLKNSRMNFEVTAEPNAIEFKPSLESMFLKGYQIEAERRALEERLDPIITVQRNHATAIIAQYGEFEFEKAAVEQAIFETNWDYSNTNFEDPY